MWSISEISEALGARAQGDQSILVSGAAEPRQATQAELAIAGTPEFASGLAEGAAQAALMWEGADWASYGLRAAILVPRPRFALATVTEKMDHRRSVKPGIHPTALIDHTADIHATASIGAHCIVEAGAKIGANVRIGAQCFLGARASIDECGWIAERVTVGSDVQIGARVTVQPGAIIGGDGFSFVTEEKSDAETVRETLGETSATDDKDGAHPQVWTRIHSLAAVEIGDNVEIGANTCIDRGTLSSTRIGAGTKIDNLVQIGHNVHVGESCLLCGLVGVAGSTVLGDRVVLGGQAGVTDHVTVGSDVIAGAGTMIRTNQPKGRVLLGDPAMPMQASIESYKALRRLPRVLRDFTAFKSALQKSKRAD